jgi:hypothetical protein
LGGGKTQEERTMNLTFKEVYNSITDKIGAGAHETYKALREAIDVINSKGFLKESQVPLAPGVFGYSFVESNYGEINLLDADNQIIKVLAVKDPNLVRMKRKETMGEYVNNFATKGEPVYEQVGDKIYVYPRISIMLTQSPGMVTITAGEDEKIKYPTEMTPVDSKFNLEIGDKLFVLEATTQGVSRNVITIKSFATTLETNDTIVVAEKGKIGADGDIITFAPAYFVVGHQVLNNFPETYDSSAIIEIKKTFVPAIKYLTLSILTGLLGKNYSNPDISKKYYNLYLAELEILIKNESIYKE